VWVEPHLYGGHALFIRRGGRGCFECAFDEEFLFEDRVIRDPHNFSMREAGCRSTYLPYSGLDANAFVASAIRFVVAAMNTSGSQLFSWTGDLKAARRAGIALGSKWEDASSFSSSVQVLVPRLSCKVCAV
jgi:hypothetical protein